jgi:hypothetical protein
MDDRAETTGGKGWLESVRRTNLAALVASQGTGPDGAATPAAGSAAVRADRGTIDDDEHLAAYNAFLARLNRPE